MNLAFLWEAVPELSALKLTVKDYSIAPEVPHFGKFVKVFVSYKMRRKR